MDYYEDSCSKGHFLDVCDIRMNDDVLVIGSYKKMVQDLIEKGCSVDIYKADNKKYDRIIIYGIDLSEKFLFDLKVCLKDGGIIFIACDNKYGMRFFSGAKHKDNSYFSSIEGMTKLYSSIELRRMIDSCGFNCYFYYPLPEYQLPFVIYSEEYLPRFINNIAHSFDYDRYIIFDEAKALNEALRSGCFEMFANSFLIKCW